MLLRKVFISMNDINDGLDLFLVTSCRSSVRTIPILIVAILEFT